MPPEPTGVLLAGEQCGNAFVDAWLSLRLDLDSLGSTSIRAGLLTEWFGQAPYFLVRDMAYIATDPGVIQAAAVRLAQFRTVDARRVLGEIEQMSTNPDQRRRIRAQRLRAGDRELIRQVVGQLHKGSLSQRVEAALTLAAAGGRRGLEALRQLARAGGIWADQAVRALGRYGKRNDGRFLGRLKTRGRLQAVIAAARGELDLRRAFPLLHSQLERRDPTARRLQAPGGLYDTWFSVLGRAIRSGVTKTSDLTQALRQIRGEPDPGFDGEVWRRRLKELLEFVEAYEKITSHTQPQPPWPARFDEALSRLTTGKGDKGKPGFVARVSAALSVVAWTGTKLGYEHLARPNPNLRVLPRGAERAVDGNLATTWSVAPGDMLQLENRGQTGPAALWLALGCPGDNRSNALSVTIKGTDAAKSWTLIRKLNPAARYYQRIDLGPRTARRIEIEITATDKPGPVCIAEIR